MTKQMKMLKKKKADIEQAIAREKQLDKEATKKGELAFYEFSQNNTGGSFHQNELLCKRLIIQATSYAAARKNALAMGVYFDGVSSGADCGCCGDRWYDCEEKIALPYRYGTFDKEEAVSISEQQGCSYDKTTWRFMKRDPPDPERYDVIFETIEQYMQYLSQAFPFFGKDTVAARVFYVNGKVKEIMGGE